MLTCKNLWLNVRQVDGETSFVVNVEKFEILTVETNERKIILIMWNKEKFIRIKKFNSSGSKPKKSRAELVVTACFPFLEVSFQQILFFEKGSKSKQTRL